MAHRFAQIVFTDSVREVQQALGSRTGYAAMDQGEDSHHVLNARESDFINARDSFYMASVSETGWPYVQHRGGPPGFVRVIDERTLGFADFRGNRAPVERGFLIRVEAFDWNCPQHITPRYAEYEIEALTAPLVEENRVLKVARGDATAPPAVLGDGPLALIISGVRQLTPRIRAYELRAGTSYSCITPAAADRRWPF